MSEYKFSVIIPTFNRCQYIPYTIASILRQTLNEVEILICDDCSFDGSRELLERIAEKHPNISVILNDYNVGAGACRNKLLDRAKGELINFLDSDDWYASTEVLERIYQTYQTHKADMILCHHQFVSTLPSYPNGVPDVYAKNLSTFIGSTNAYDNPEVLHANAFFNFSYANEFVQANSIRFREDLRWEDQPFFIEAALRAKSISIKPEVSHSVRRHPASIMGQHFTPEQVVSTDDIHERAKLVDALYQSFSVARNSAVFPLATKKYRNNIKRRILQSAILTDLRKNPDALQQLTQDERMTLTNSLHLLIATLDKITAQQHCNSPDFQSLTEQRAELAEFLTEVENSFKKPIAQQSYVSRPCYVKASKREAFLHIGRTKTGSTYIQHALEINEQLLNEHDCYVGTEFYSRGVPTRMSHGPKHGGHGFLARYTVNQKRHNRKVLEFRKAIQDKKWHKLILSTEMLTYPPTVGNIKLIQDLLEDYDVWIIIYQRNPADWVESEYKERVSNAYARETDPLGHCIHNYLFTWSLSSVMIRDWAKIFGGNRIKVRVYEEATQLVGGIFADFLSVCGLDDLAHLITYPEIQANPSLGRVYTEILRQFNILSSGLTRERRFEMLQQLVQLMDYYVDDDRASILSPRDKVRLTQKWGEKNIDLVKRGFLTEEQFENLLQGAKVSTDWLPIRGVDSLALELAATLANCSADDWDGVYSSNHRAMEAASASPSTETPDAVTAPSSNSEQFISNRQTQRGILGAVKATVTYQKLKKVERSVRKTMR